MISYDDAEKALNYLKATDEEAARAKALYQGLDEAKKTVLACEFMKADGSASERNQIALSSGEYLLHLEKMDNSLLDFEIIKNRRKSAELQIEMWRSVNSNQRKGNI